MPASRPPTPPPAPLPTMGDKRQWSLDPSWAFLNHGSFGARPKMVRRMQANWQARFESHPIRFLDIEQVRPMLDTALASLARFLGVDQDGLVFLPNVTDAVATALRTTTLSGGDDVLTTSHAYPAVLRAIEARCSDVGATPNVVPIPCPVPTPDAIESAVLGAVTKRTRLAILDQVTSPTALRLPVDRLVPALRRRGIEVLVDGAHAGGMLAKPCPAGATWWTTNLHKWGLAPLGCAVLWTCRSHRGRTRPLAPSHAHFKGYQAAFAWQGTRDVSAWLTAPQAIEWVSANGGWPALRRHNAAMARWAGDRLVEAWGTTTAGPASMRRGVSMVTVQLPDACRQWRVPERLRDALAHRHKVEAPVWNDGPRWWMRISCQAYTRPSHIERLIDAIKELR